MINVGITGQSGFIGIHLFNTIGLYPDRLTRIPFIDDYFQSKNSLESFVMECDVIVHLAAMNRHNDPEVIYKTNLKLVKQIIAACEATHSTPHILFSSSTQEEQETPYGKSKKEGRDLFEQWANNNNADFSGFIIPNVYGPFGHPYYNSVVATFCHQITHNEQSRIEVDGELKLIYVSELITQMITVIEKISTKQKANGIIQEIRLQHTSEIKVSALLEILEDFKRNYFEKGSIPALNTTFMRNIFNTFLCYIDFHTFFPFRLKLNTDNRGSFVETIKLNSGGLVSFSTTGPGITRGNHYHTRKAERFAVIKGKARIEIRQIGTTEVHSFELNGKEPSFVDMPVWYTHNITNIGDEELFTVFWINEHFDVNDPDTFFERV